MWDGGRWAVGVGEVRQPAWNVVIPYLDCVVVMQGGVVSQTRAAGVGISTFPSAESLRLPD